MDKLKQYRYFIAGGVLLLIVLIGFAVFYFTNTPEKTLKKYFTYVNAGNYEKIYNELIQDPNNVDRQYFLDRYNKIYIGIEAKNISSNDITRKDEQMYISVGNTESQKVDLSDKNHVLLNYTLEMDTLAGHYQGQTSAWFVRDGLFWKMDWNEGVLIPGMSSMDTVTVSTTPAQRGNIYDRNGNLLAGKGEVLEIGIVPGKLNPATKDTDIQTLASLLSTTPDAINQLLTQSWVTDDVRVPITTTDKTNTALEAEVLKVAGIYTDTAEKRVYPYGEKAAHLTGYIQGISPEELEAHPNEGYTESSVIGKAGLEAAFESRLHGKDGVKIEIDRGTATDYQQDDGSWIQKPDIWTLQETPAENGQDITVTIDMNLQTKLYDQFAQDKSASVAMNPKTGEILALVSTPSYDANAFIKGLSDDAWNALNTDGNKPLLNRFEASFAPGSSFKPVTAAIGVTGGKLDPNADMGPSGTSWQKDASWGDLMITTLQAYDGPANLANALIYSDNIYFAKAALQIGGDSFKDGLNKMGFGQTIDFPFALTPSQISNDGNLGDEGLLAQSGYGQGEVLVNPVHMASIYSAFTNDGSMIKPVLEYNGTPAYLYEDVMTKETADLIRNDLTQVVENPAGTAHEAYVPGIVLAGKTGTAEIKANQQDTTGTELGWFNAFIADPASQKQLLVVSMVEDVKDRGGSHYLVPKVKSVFEN